jgi:dihydrofolate synthase/folylpolyglutamate synthase
VVSAPQEPEALAVIEATAREKNAPLILVGRDIIATPDITRLDGQTFSVRTQGHTAHTFHMPLLGRHQVVNATTALAAAHELKRQGWRIRPSEMKCGIATVEWHARLEILSRAPIIIADGAHNRASAHELVVALRDLFPHAHIHFIFGASREKDITGMFTELLPKAATLILTRYRQPRAASLETLAQLAAPFNVATTIAPSVAEALDIARARVQDGDTICATGSLFVAAEARAKILAERGVKVDSDD